MSSKYHCREVKGKVKVDQKIWPNNWQLLSCSCSCFALLCSWSLMTQQLAVFMSKEKQSKARYLSMVLNDARILFLEGLQHWGHAQIRDCSFGGLAALAKPVYPASVLYKLRVAAPSCSTSKILNLGGSTRKSHCTTNQSFYILVLDFYVEGYNSLPWNLIKTGIV